MEEKPLSKLFLGETSCIPFFLYEDGSKSTNLGLAKQNIMIMD